MLYIIRAQNYYRVPNGVYLFFATDTKLGAARRYTISL
jgi:hypothetical protein